MAAHAYVLLDVFTDTPLTGNPLAVFTDGSSLDADTMQRIAREMNLSETVFLLERTLPATAEVRIFTPALEMPFAGHPVLGAAVVLAAESRVSEVTLVTPAGAVEVRLAHLPAGVGEMDLIAPGAVASGWMVQPLPSWRLYADEAGLLAALGVERAALPVEVYDNGASHVMVAVGDGSAVAALKPDQSALADMGDVCVSCFAADGARVHTRMFAAGAGVAEDPATGSAAGPLALHLARHGVLAFGTELEISQGAEIGRPSRLRAVARGREERVESVEVGGDAVVVGRGELSL
jgi:trans-2,3-dihydro-3-hydroxyanthranilate isomerase